MTGIPTDQQSDNKSARLTYGLFAWSSVVRISLAVAPASEIVEGAPDMSSAPTALPKEVIADSSSSPSPERCLKRASSFQTKRGWCPSSISDRGSKPSFLAKENRNSTRAETE